MQIQPCASAEVSQNRIANLALAHYVPIRIDNSVRAGLGLRLSVGQQRVAFCERLPNGDWSSRGELTTPEERKTPAVAGVKSSGGHEILPPAFDFSRVSDKFDAKVRWGHEIASSGCFRLLPVDSRYGGCEQGQNRDKFFRLPGRLSGLATRCCGQFVRGTVVRAGRQRPLIQTYYIRATCNWTGTHSGMSTEDAACSVRRGIKWARARQQIRRRMSVSICD